METFSLFSVVLTDLTQFENLCTANNCQHSLNSQMSNAWSYPPLNDAAEVASQVRDILAKRGLALGH